MAETRLRLEHKILVGTHHKTGTRWLHKIFSRICEDNGLMLFDGEPDRLPAHADVFFHAHSGFDLERNAGSYGTYRGVHMIRDPRDVVISGCFYHQSSREPWLRTRRDDLGGMTYQETINSYGSLDDQVLFEMEHAALMTVREMLAWDYSNPNFLELKYEDLLRDETLGHFRELFGFLGFPPDLMPGLLDAAHGLSLFSGNKEKDRHVRSGQPGEWKGLFKPAHRARFSELFGDALTELGYETGDAWVGAP